MLDDSLAGADLPYGGCVAVQVRQSLERLDALHRPDRVEAPGRVGQDQFHVGIPLAVRPDPVLIGGIGHRSLLDHVKRDADAELVGYSHQLFGQELGYLRVPRRLVGAFGVVAL